MDSPSNQTLWDLDSIRVGGIECPMIEGDNGGVLSQRRQWNEGRSRAQEPTVIKQQRGHTNPYFDSVKNADWQKRKTMTLGDYMPSHWKMKTHGTLLGARVLSFLGRMVQEHPGPSRSSSRIRSVQGSGGPFKQVKTLIMTYWNL